MRYTNKANGDWVEFKPGFCKVSMSKVLAASNTPSLLMAWVDKCEFTSDEGAKVSPVDGQTLMDAITFQQWDWLSARLIEWSRDDLIDPEV